MAVLDLSTVIDCVCVRESLVGLDQYLAISKFSHGPSDKGIRLAQCEYICPYNTGIKHRYLRPLH